MLNGLKEVFSPERLNTYGLNTETEEAVLEKYAENLRIAESFYTAISILEVCLRNAISEAIHNETPLKSEWLVQEINTRTFLTERMHRKLQKANSKVLRQLRNRVSPVAPYGKLVAELTFGFWVHLFTRDYIPGLWMKYNYLFKNVFPNYDKYIKPDCPNISGVNTVNVMYSKLKIVLDFRNRVFHYEPIFNHPAGLDNLYSDIEKIVGAMSEDALGYMQKYCRFSEIRQVQSGSVNENI